MQLKKQRRYPEARTTVAARVPAAVAIELQDRASADGRTLSDFVCDILSGETRQPRAMMIGARIARSS